MRSRYLFILVFLIVHAGCAVRPSPVVNRSAGGSFLLEKVMRGRPLPEPAFPLLDPGAPVPVDYSQYGTFEAAGTPDYHFIVKDREGLKAAVGAGIYPNHQAVLKHPFYKELRKKKFPPGAHWDYLNSGDPQTAFYLWTQAPEDSGVRTFFTGLVLEKAGRLRAAIRAYYAAMVHFPRSVGWSADRHFVWYVAAAAKSRIERLCRDYPQLGLDLVDADVRITNGTDTDLGNDVVSVNPGRLVRRPLRGKMGNLPDLDALPVIATRGSGRVRLVQYANKHWQMRVDGKPFFVRGVTYSPTKIGRGPHKDFNFLDRWMFEDDDHNGRIDAAADAWVDKNGNGRRDPDEPAVGDFELMKEAGINAIRWFVPNKNYTEYDPSLVNKPLLRDLWARYGIGVIAVDPLGAYTIGSGATWEEGTDYTDPVQCRTMKAALRAKVMDLKDEPFMLMWILGNENNIPGDYNGRNATRTNAASHPEAYARFLNEAAVMIHELDPDHPVAVGNMGTGLLEDYQKYAPAVDVIGINAYPGPDGFGDLWAEISRKFDRPVLLAEYGCDAYAEGKGVDEDAQAAYHERAAREIILNQGGGPATGNVIGGVIFEYIDEWWKDTFEDPEDHHQEASRQPAAFPDGFSHDEWYGIVSQGSGRNSPFERHLRKAYSLYKELWNP